MKIYISGKISGLDIDHAKAVFEHGEHNARRFFGKFVTSDIFTERANESGNKTKATFCNDYLIETINPMKKVSEGEGLTYDDYMREDIKLLMDCAGIWMIRGWKESKGAVIEHDLAKALHLAIGYEND